jgi:hypothetical protein
MAAVVSTKKSCISRTDELCSQVSNFCKSDRHRGTMGGRGILSGPILSDDQSRRAGSDPFRVCSTEFLVVLAADVISGWYRSVRQTRTETVMWATCSVALPSCVRARVCSAIGSDLRPFGSCTVSLSSCSIVIECC